MSSCQPHSESPGNNSSDFVTVLTGYSRHSDLGWRTSPLSELDVFVGHVPAGYVVSKFLAPKLPATALKQRYLIAAGMIGAVAPDLDVFYFYLVDNRQHHHHLYFSHLPVVWFSLMAISALWVFAVRSRAIPLLAFIFSLNGMIHMFLDTIAGDIWWLGPWVNAPFALVTVPARFQPWWLNFLLHWTFLLEVLVLFLAAIVWRRGHGEG